MSNNEHPWDQPDDCRCGRSGSINAPWNYMGPWHDESCWMFGPLPPVEELLSGERYGE